MRKLRFFGALILVLYWFSASAKVCVLSLFKAGTQADKIIKSSFLSRYSDQPIDPNIDFFPDAELSQVKNCFERNDIEEILLTGHAIHQSTSGMVMNFPTFHQKNPDSSQIISERFFKKLAELTIISTNLKKIRIAVCAVNSNSEIAFKDSNPKQGWPKSSMDHLIRAARIKGIEVDFLQNSSLGTAIVGYPVVAIATSRPWMRKSIHQGYLTQYLYSLPEENRSE